MKMYEEPKAEVIFFYEENIVSASAGEEADDLGGWNKDWF